MSRALTVGDGKQLIAKTRGAGTYPFAMAKGCLKGWPTMFPLRATSCARCPAIRFWSASGYKGSFCRDTDVGDD